MQQVSGDKAEFQKRIQRASWLLVGSILISRLIGFVREWVLAYTIGANALTDVYYASFTIPDFINYLMAAGALSISFIPLLSDYLSRGEEETAKRVFRSLLSWMGGVLVIFIVVAEIFAEPLGRAIAPGFDAEQNRLLALLLRIILPAQFFFYFGSLAMSVQHTHGRFFIPAIAPIVYNGGIILFGVGLGDQLGITGFSIGVLIGALFSHGLLQWWGLRSLGFSCLPYFSLPAEIRSGLKRYLLLTIPLALSFSLLVTDEWISKYFASALEARALSYLSYARTEMRIPLAIIGQAAGVASFPFLAKLWFSGRKVDYGSTLLRELMKMWAAGPIAAIVLWVFALPATHFIYGGGKFTAVDLQSTAEALRMYSLGVFFWVAQVLLARGFYACQKTWLPSLLGGVCTLLTIPLYYRLAREMGFIGLALAGSIGIAVYCVLLFILLLVHLRKHEAVSDWKPFLWFCGLWVPVILVTFGLCVGIQSLGIYKETRISAFLEIVAVVSLVGLVCIGLLRTVFRKVTGGALY
jgi:putative peptidoglycan lipid II flippase